MPLSLLDIHNKEFTRGFRGYAEDEVNEFLDQIIKDYEIVLREKKELEDKVKAMSEQMSHFNSMEETLQKSIVVAQEAADEVRRNSQKESKLIVKEAEKNADRIINDDIENSSNKQNIDNNLDEELIFDENKIPDSMLDPTFNEASEYNSEILKQRKGLSNPLGISPKP